jgi:hypothetical protein
MVAAKLRETELHRATRQDLTPSPELRHLQSTGEESGRSEDVPEQSPRDEFAMNIGHTSQLQQLLDFDPVREATPTISRAWITLKYDHKRRLQPILEHSLRTRKFANPTLRNLLRYYDQPIRVNSETGEKMPLMEVLEREDTKQQGAQSMLTQALELKARRNQVRAEALLHRKQAQVDIPLQEPTMYLPREEYDFLEKPPPREEVRIELVKALSPMGTTRKRQHMFLTEDGAIVGKSEHPHTSREVGENHTFLTAQGERDSSEACTATTAMYRSRWQPLSSTAAQEYEGTRVVPLKLTSLNRGHGKYSMWKPLS